MYSRKLSQSEQPFGFSPFFETLFSTVCCCRLPTPYNAYFVPGSDPELTVYPSSGELMPPGSHGTRLSVTFSPNMYGRSYRGRLVVQVQFVTKYSVCLNMCKFPGLAKNCFFNALFCCYIFVNANAKQDEYIQAYVDHFSKPSNSRLCWTTMTIQWQFFQRFITGQVFEKCGPVKSGLELGVRSSTFYLRNMHRFPQTGSFLSFLINSWLLQTLDMQWAYDVKGVTPDYHVPNVPSAILTSTLSRPRPLVQRRRVNYVRKNLKLTATAVSSPIKGSPLVKRIHT